MKKDKSKEKHKQHLLNQQKRTKQHLFVYPECLSSRVKVQVIFSCQHNIVGMFAAAVQLQQELASLLRVVRQNNQLVLRNTRLQRKHNIKSKNKTILFSLIMIISSSSHLLSPRTPFQTACHNSLSQHFLLATSTALRASEKTPRSEQDAR
jgi:hypothetical protein